MRKPKPPKPLCYFCPVEAVRGLEVLAQGHWQKVCAYCYQECAAGGRIDVDRVSGKPVVSEVTPQALARKRAGVGRVLDVSDPALPLPVRADRV